MKWALCRMFSQEGMSQWLVHFSQRGAFHLESIDLAWFHVPSLLSASSASASLNVWLSAVRFTAFHWDKWAWWQFLWTSGTSGQVGMDTAESSTLKF